MKSTVLVVGLLFAALLVGVASPADANSNRGSGPGYEVWGADQSNSVADAPTRGVDGVTSGFGTAKTSNAK